MYSGKKARPRRGAGRNATEDYTAWDEAKCRAIEIGVGGGFLILALLEVLFRC